MMYVAIDNDSLLMTGCRFGSSLKQNLTYYLSIAVAGLIGIGLLLISGRLRASDLLPLAMLLSNTYGECCTHPFHGACCSKFLVS